METLIHKYAIRGFKWHLFSAVSFAVACLLFLCCCYVDGLKISAKKMKLKVRVKLSEQNNCGNDHRKYAIRGSDRQLPYAVAVAVSDVLFLCCCYIDCLKISAKQKWNWRLAENGKNKRTAEVIIVNIPSGELTTPNLCCWYCFCSLLCAFAAEIV